MMGICTMSLFSLGLPAFDNRFMGLTVEEIVGFVLVKLILVDFVY